MKIFKNFFQSPTPESVAVRDLHEARLSLLSIEKEIEYWSALKTSLQTRITRLTKLPTISKFTAYDLSSPSPLTGNAHEQLDSSTNQSQEKELGHLSAERYARAYSRVETTRDIPTGGSVKG